MFPEEQLNSVTSGADESGPESTKTMDSGEGARTLLGRYRLLYKIGEGGMGEVWLAEQEDPVRRRVALKLVNAGMKDVLARFESERQALALMNHPAIAKVFDAGSTPQGVPYFVMECVAGAPITVYCDNHKLSTRERLELFIHVCEGVQHAHQKAIIHRDLKPTNILVAEVDGQPAPRIIDFGVAKALTLRPCWVRHIRTRFIPMGVLANAFLGQGKYAQAEALYSETLETQSRVLGSEHPNTLMSMNNLADVYAAEGKYAQAEVLFNKNLEAKRRVLGPAHPNTLGALADAAAMYELEGKYVLAETYAMQALAGRRRLVGSEHPKTMADAAVLALVYVSERKFTEAEPLARDIARTKQPEDWERYRAESLLGASLAGHKKYTEAEPLLLEGYQGMLARKDHRIWRFPDWYHLDRAPRMEWFSFTRRRTSRRKPTSGKGSKIGQAGVAVRFRSSRFAIADQTCKPRAGG